MIDLTPLDVRNKRGDFKRILRGYDPQEVDIFLELVGDRLEDLVREVMHLRERADALQQQVSSQSGREQAVQEALVSAQELRKEIRGQAQREADLVLKEVEVEARRQRAEAEAEIRRMLRDAERKLEQAQDGLEEMERRRLRFLKAYRQLLEREMDVVQVEEERKPLEERPIELDLLGGRTFESVAGPAGVGAAAGTATDAAPQGPVPQEPAAHEPAPPALEPAAPAAPGAPNPPISAPPATADTIRSPQEVIEALSPERRPPLDMAVDELAALYEGLEGPLDALAARYGILKGKEGSEGPEGGDAPRTASGDAAADEGAEAPPKPEEPDFFSPPHHDQHDGSDDPRWG